MKCFISVSVLVVAIAAAPLPEGYDAPPPLDSDVFGSGFGLAGRSDLTPSLVGNRPDQPLGGPFNRPRGGPLGGNRPSFGRRGPLDDVLGRPGMPYSFSWAVDEPEYGNDYGHAEESDGVVTRGEYHVLLPDGRTQVVTYIVEGDSGFQATVTYEGEAQFPLAGQPGGPGPFAAGPRGALGGRGSASGGGPLGSPFRGLGEPSTGYGL